MSQNIFKIIFSIVVSSETMWLYKDIHTFFYQR